MCDFWKDGAAFDNSWELLCKTNFEYEDFADITHLWISHEHPDHFSPANLSAIPAEYRENIVVLFQHTVDKRVVSFCNKLNFASVIELQHFESTEIAEDVELICAPYGAAFGDVDSWLCIRTPDCNLLNINDCEIESTTEMERIHAACGPIDVLATQFSFASKQGDLADPTWVSRAQRYHLEKFELKVSSFKPKYTLPFASFVYWSHIENRYLNEGAITVQQATQSIEQCDSIPVVMYPDDEWTVGEDWHNTTPLRRYDDRYRAIDAMPDSEFSSSPTIDHESLIEQSQKFLHKMTQDIDIDRIRRTIAIEHSYIRTRGKMSRIRQRMNALISGLTGRYERVSLFVEDHNQAYQFSLERGLTECDLRHGECDISIGSQALHFCLSVPFGGESLQINGRFQNLSPKGWRYLSRVFFLARRIDQKIVPPRFVVLAAVLQSIGLVRTQSAIAN